MKINANTIKPGMVLQHNGGLWVVTKASHVKPGKGGAFANVEAKNLETGDKLNERFRSTDKADRVTPSSSWTTSPMSRSNCKRAGSAKTASLTFRRA